MHPASYYLAQANLAGLRHQTQRDALATALSAITTGAGIYSPHYRPRRAGRQAGLRGSPKRSIP
jgi:hypothetical protein